MSDPLSFAVPFSSQGALFCGLTLHIHRNLSGFLFPSKMSPQDKQRANAHLVSVLKAHNPQALLMTPPCDQKITQALSSKTGEAASYIIDPDQQLTYTLIDQDHLRASLHRYELDFNTLYHDLQTIQSTLSSLFHFSHSPQYGYLTSCPEFSGLGVELEAYIFCPLLETWPDLEDQHLLLKPCFNSDSFYCLKTVSTHNLDLSTVLQSSLKTLSNLIHAETCAQKEQLKTHKDALLDRVCKSLALLKGAYQLSFTETLNHLLNLKLGFHLGFLKGMSEDISLKLLSGASQISLADHFHQNQSPDNWLHERAVWIQKQLLKITLTT
jgi:protein arginine kinase